MSATLRIAVADDEPLTLADFQESLTSLGHDVVCAAVTGQQLIDQCLALQPDLIITDIKMPDMDGIDAAAAISRVTPIPVILVTGHQDSELIERALADHVLAYLIKPVKSADLEPAIALAMRRFQEFQALHQQAADLRQAIEDRKVLERAKGVLMRKGGLSEEEAFRALQKLSRDKNQKMVEIAKMIILADEALRESAKSKAKRTRTV